MSYPYTIRLTDDDDGIEIVKSGAPAPSEAMLAWLAAECRGPWRLDVDGVFNLDFRFADEGDAERFAARWRASPGSV